MRRFSVSSVCLRLSNRAIPGWKKSTLARNVAVTSDGSDPPIADNESLTFPLDPIPVWKLRNLRENVTNETKNQNCFHEIERTWRLNLTDETVAEFVFQFGSQPDTYSDVDLWGSIRILERIAQLHLLDAAIWFQQVQLPD